MISHNSMSFLKRRSNLRKVVATAATAILCLTTFVVVPVQASAYPYASNYWIDPATGDRYEVDYTAAAFNGPATVAAPSLIQSGKYVLHANANNTFEFCQYNPFPGYYPHTKQCMRQAEAELVSRRSAIDTQLGSFASCRATVGRQLLANRSKAVKLVFVSGAVFYGYSVTSQYLSHVLPQHIGATATTHVIAVLLAATVIATGLINLLADSDLTIPELAATIFSWFGNTQLAGYMSDLATFMNSHNGETIAHWYMDHSGVAHPSCTQLANEV
jgi:hypothetical protein